MSKIAFILGAGAHAPFNFPTGEQLKSLVADSLGSYSGPDETKFREARRALMNCGVSIDRFLANNQHFNDVIRPRIARVLLGFESSALNGSMSNWIQYLWQLLPIDSRRGLNDRFVFITFNYDRLLEYRIAQGCMGLWGMNLKQASDQLGCLNIYHVYGSFGEITPGQTTYYEFGRTDDFATAGKGIKIIGENDHEPTKEVHKRLADCKHLFMMGCAYHRENMALLSLDKLPTLDNRSIHGCTFGLSRAERQRLSKQYPFMAFGDQHHDCLATLRETTRFQKLIT